MAAIARRNIKVFFRDKGAVFFSLMSVFIIIGLYVLFLSNTLATNMQGVKGIDFLRDSWVMAGILAVVSLATTLGAFGIVVDDRVTKRLKDFYSSPIKRSDLAGGYILSALVIGIIMSLITFAAAEALHCIFRRGAAAGCQCYQGNWINIAVGSLQQFNGFFNCFVYKKP